MRKTMKKVKSEQSTGERNLGVFLTPADGASGAGFVMPMGDLNVGPGEPGPGDEWHMPAAGSTPKQIRPEPKPRVLEERPQAQKNLGVFMSPDLGQGGGGFLVPMEPLNVGPGEPGPEDAWKLPDAPSKKA